VWCLNILKLGTMGGGISWKKKLNKQKRKYPAAFLRKAWVVR